MHNDAASEGTTSGVTDRTMMLTFCMPPPTTPGAIPGMTKTELTRTRVGTRFKGRGRGTPDHSPRRPLPPASPRRLGPVPLKYHAWGWWLEVKEGCPTGRPGGAPALPASRTPAGGMPQSRSGLSNVPGGVAEEGVGSQAVPRPLQGPLEDALCAPSAERDDLQGVPQMGFDPI